MTLNDFLNMSFDTPVPVAVAKYKYFDDVYDKIQDDDSSWKKDCEFCIDERFTQWRCHAYIRDEFASAEVKAFRILPKVMVVWVRSEDE